MELRGETALLRDRHARHYADLDRRAGSVGPRRASDRGRGNGCRSEWDNLRAAHLWSLAQGDLDLAERLAEGSFQYCGLQHAPRTRCDAGANRATRRRAAAGRRRPCSACSATGYDWQGNEEDAAARSPSAASTSHPHSIIPPPQAAGSSSPAPRPRSRPQSPEAAGRLPPPRRRRRPTPPISTQLVHIGLSHRRVAALRSHCRTGVAANS